MKKHLALLIGTAALLSAASTSWVCGEYFEKIDPVLQGKRASEASFYLSLYDTCVEDSKRLPESLFTKRWVKTYPLGEPKK